MSAILYSVNKHKHTQEVTSGGDPKLSIKNNGDDIVGCDKIEVEDVWVVGIPKFLTESAFRLVDINKDGVLDVIMGFGTGADGYDIPEVVCDIYFHGQSPCYGGVMALEGKTGKVLWKQFSKHELFGLNCNVDLNEDGVLDCLAGGRAGTFDAISGKDGDVLWRYGKTDLMNFYTPQFIADIDGDKVSDILQIHGGDPLQDPGSKYRLSGNIMLFSGKTGQVIKTIGVPDKKESYYSPQIYSQKDGTQIVLFGTGGETHGGSLWRITLNHLIKGQIYKAKRIYTDNFKGVMTPPVLLDINKDEVVDIVISMFNSTVLAIDGRTFHVIWNYTFPSSETYCTPAAGYYNDDEVPDFLIKYQNGPGFPIYYSSETTVLDGKTGQPLISPSVKDSIGAQSSPLTISVEGRGNDIFLFWVADCLGHVGQGGQYGFVKGTNVHEKSRSDNCRLRFKTKGFTELLAKSRHIKSRGVRIYYSGQIFFPLLFVFRYLPN
ncbi:hypothetical protein LOTGIDRAFT_113097 [Lottia gigantea]|uniref:FAM234A/B beta-propeller domain-containing protein n=1 Tax=Lottia gigantea TaxID=225164 RepID=V4A7S4_LOTGI|nr:hypothetical protein LOTGIDRAFT_113097 [Lottia gigantea]ESP00009.1 hypothetical protein LOTGIDRAFT_113097 [Lottia gigantea]